MKENTYNFVGTLCDEPNGLTCSFDATQKWGKAKNILHFKTFEEAALEVKRGVVEAFVVPCAYPNLSTFIMDVELEARELFKTRIPPLVVVGKFPKPLQSVQVLFHHPATTPLLPEVQINFEEHTHVTSNSQACKSLLSASDRALAITNKLCADFYQLEIYQELRKGILMPFICFVRA